MSAAGYGTWKSPISSQMTTQSAVKLMQLRTDSDPDFSDTVYWNEMHPDEGGRYVICSSNPAGDIQQWTPEQFNARTTVHEYGGGDFIVHKGVVYFSNFSDQAVYKQTSPTSPPEPITDNTQNMRYADGYFCPQNSRIFYVREDHKVVDEGAKEPENTLVSVDPVSKKESVLVKGANFYSSPRVSPDGKKIVWIQWFHPNMPWDSTEMWTADLSNSGDNIVKESAVKIAGGKDSSGQDLSVSLPSWTAKGDLLYVSDQTDWWNLYHVTSTGHVNLHAIEAEIGGPQWTLGVAAYVQEPNAGHRIVTTFGKELGLLDTSTGSYQKIDTGFESHTPSSMGWTASGSIYLLVSSPTKFPQVIRLDVNTFKVTVIRESMRPSVDEGYFSVPQHISWDTTNGDKCHGLLYNPQNKDFTGKPGELPPVRVCAHGGPTSAFTSALSLNIQYFTSRGFAVLCVNYRGSTGYGKIYRYKLRGKWGLLDIDDCRTGVEHLIRQKLADPKRVCIDGWSAGGYTTLACLTFTNIFQVGVSHYGISDLEALMTDTHKFESHYLETLIAPWDDEHREVFRKRSPIHFTNQINCAMGFFQGDEDKVVPPNQAQMMYEAVKAKGLPAMFVLFKGEQHGFKKAENIQKAFDGEFYFFGKVLGFEPADKGIDIPIDNLPS